MRRILPLAVLALAALAIAACGESDDVDPGAAADAPDFSRAVAAAPPPLAGLYAHGGVVLDGGLEAYEAQIAALEGHPIVVNKWASWCGPCRAEFPHLQSQVARHGDRIAFVGIDSDDSRDAAETFLRDHPVPYPSFFDPDEELAESIGAVFAFPSTVFYDREGEIVHRKEGVYATEEELAADLERFAQAGSEEP